MTTPLPASSAAAVVQASSDQQTLSPLRYRVFGLTWLSYVMYYLTRKNFSVAKSSIQDALHIDNRSLGYIDMAYSMTYSVGQFLWGWAADRVGPRRVIGIGMLATAICSFWMGTSHAFWVILFAWGLNGLAQSTGWSPNVKAMTGWFDDKKRGAIMGFWTTNYSVGAFISNPIAYKFLEEFGWRAAFFGPAVAVALMGFVILFLLPEQARVLPEGESTVESKRIQDDAEAMARRAARARVIRNPLIWALAGSYFFMKLARYFFWYWSPFYMEKVLGYSKGLAILIPLIFDAAGVVGAILIGHLSDKVLRGRRIPIAVVSLVLLSACLAIYSRVAPQGVFFNVVVLALCGFFLFGPDALVSATAAQDLGGPAAAATAAGIINGCGSLGQILSGPLAPEQNVGADWGFIYGLLGVGTLISALILAPFWRVGQKSVA